MNDNINVVVGGPINADYPKLYKTKFLKPGIPFSLQVTEPNTKYVIKHNFVLDGDVTIPANCVLEFDGGSVSAGNGQNMNTITGNNTGINTGLVKIFNTDIILAGTWNVKEGYPQWFGIYPDDDSVDTTPIIKKMVAVSIPIFFCAGVWYLSECLLNGKANVNIKGETISYKTGTVFKALNPNGQRFILKLGGNADFSEPTDYYAVWCSNFVLDGINFNTYDTTFVNANSDMGQNYAAVCFDWCVEGYVNIRHGGNCPGVFIANTWEVYFENIVCYGSYTSLNESAIYFGKAYTNVNASNISAITINNLFAEMIYGKIVDCHNNSNIANLIINNIELEPRNGNSSNVSHSGNAAYSIIENNIRNIDVLYYFNFAGNVTIHSITYTGQSVTYENDTIARGILRSSTSGGHVVVDKIFNVSYSNITNIYGAVGYGRLSIDKIESETHSGTVQIYTVKNAVPDFSNIYDGFTTEAGLGVVTIKRSCAIVDKDLIKVYTNGLVFNSENPEEVITLQRSNNKSAVIFGYIDSIAANLVYFRGVTFSRKFKFVGQKLIFRYTAPNKWETNNIVITYYKNNSVIHTDNIKLAYSDTQLLEYKYGLYTESYDYCTIKFNAAICIESIEVKELNDAVSGTWNDRPSSADISVGFAYFCTDKRTVEGAADGIMIYHKGSDVWVDAFGRVVI